MCFSLESVCISTYGQRAVCPADPKLGVTRVMLLLPSLVVAATAAERAPSADPCAARAVPPPLPPRAQWGAVVDLQILRERATGASRGCAFVGYDSSEDAEAAIQHLNHRVHLPGALAPLEVG